MFQIWLCIRTLWKIFTSLIQIHVIFLLYIFSFFIYEKYLLLWYKFMLFSFFIFFFFVRTSNRCSCCSLCLVCSSQHLYLHPSRPATPASRPTHIQVATSLVFLKCKSDPIPPLFKSPWAYRIKCKYLFLAWMT